MSFPSAHGPPISTASPLLSPVLMTTLTHDFRFTHLSPVQAGVLPQVLDRSLRRPKNVLVDACTGSGKTLAFVLPMLELLLRRRVQVRTEDPTSPSSATPLPSGLGLILLPTRELAAQVKTILEVFVRRLSLPETNLQLQVDLIVGGTPTRPSYNGQIYVATPGRLWKLLQDPRRYGMYLRNCEYVVLDEADQMLGLGLGEQVRFILGRNGAGIVSNASTCSNPCWIGCFSATMMSRVRLEKLLGDSSELGGIPALGNAIKIRVRVCKKKKRKRVVGEEEGTHHGTQDVEMNEPTTTTHERTIPMRLSSKFVVCPRSKKFSNLLNLVQQVPKSIVFFLTCSCVDFFGGLLTELLPQSSLFLLHGKMVQKRRERTFGAFRAAESGILIATDVAARGIDVVDVQRIVQYDPPTDPNVFIHRAGRTARMGREGDAIVLLTEDERQYVGYIEAKGVPLLPLQMHIGDSPENPERTDLHSQVHALVMQDRDLFDKSEAAFASFVHSYRKHICKSLFRLGRLDFDDLAVEFSLLRRPPTRESRLYKFRQFTGCEAVRIEDIPYKDTRREAARQARKQRERQRPAPARPQKKRTPDGIAAIHQRKRRVRKEKSRTHSKQRLAEYQALEYREMREEEQLRRRFHQGKISEREYEQMTGEDRFRELFKREFNWVDRKPTRKRRRRKKARERRRKRRKTGPAAGQEVDVK